MLDSDPMAETIPSSETGAKEFFEGYARDFDHIYDEGGKGAFSRFVDTHLRKEMRMRFEKTLRVLAPMQGKSLLDAGLRRRALRHPRGEGGRVARARHRLQRAHAQLAREKAAAEGVGEVCRFELGDLLTYPLRAKSFDYAIAIGFFDYMQDPEATLRALARATREKVFVSIPKRWHILTPQRYLRYTYFQCYIRFYSRPEVVQLAEAVTPKRFTIFDIDREYNLLVELA